MYRFFCFKSCTIMTFMILLKPRMSGKNLVLELNAKILSANQIAGFLNFKISKTTGILKLIFCMQVYIY